MSMEIILGVLADLDPPDYDPPRSKSTSGYRPPPPVQIRQRKWHAMELEMGTENDPADVSLDQGIMCKHLV